MTTNKKGLYLLLGISLVTQATTSLVGGIIGFGPFTDTDNIPDAMTNIADNISSFYTGIFLQIITALVIIALGEPLYQAGKSVGKTAAVIAMGFYMLEVVIVVFDQMVIYGITEVSKQFAISGDTGLLEIAKLLFSVRNFGGAIAMMPFGLGAILFYYLIMKAGVIPKWLGIWGLITVPFILVGWSLSAFGVSVPFALYIPYVPWEWVAGIYILIKGISTKSNVITNGSTNT